MERDLTLTTKKIIDASVSKVWEALTEPELIKQYFFETEAVSDWREGSPITFRGSWEGQEYLDKGTILEIDEEKLLKFSYWSSMSGLEDKPENYATITYRLEAENGQTALTVVQKGYKGREAYEHSTEMWNEVLKKLTALVTASS